MKTNGKTHSAVIGYKKRKFLTRNSRIPELGPYPVSRNITETEKFGILFIYSIYDASTH
jgi:hypothetical protein